MNENVTQYWNKVQQYWQKTTKTQRWLMIGTAVISFITLSLLIYHFSKTEYAVAYTDLEASDAAAIRDYLENAGVPYRFSNDGSTIGVPSKMVTQVKIDAESQNLIDNGSIGYGIFRDNLSSFGMTDNQFGVLQIDAKAGEIQQLINAMDGVKSSKVLLTMQERSVFIRDDMADKPSASVVVQFQNGYPVDQLKIDTMYSLVEKSVQGLDQENITISNQEGELLPSSRLNEGMGQTQGIAAQQFAIKKQYETDIQKNVQNFLGQIMGHNRVAVNVVATLNFDQENRQERLFTPVNELDQRGIERSVQEIQKSYTSDGGTEPGGIAGTGGTDIPNYPSADPSGTVDSEEMETIINYEVNEITKSIVSSPYVVQDLTIVAGIEPPLTENPESLSEETQEEIRQMLSNIISASLVDSDKEFTQDEIESRVVVMARSFAEREPLPVETSWLEYALYALAGAVAMALLGGGTYYVIKKRNARFTEPEPFASTSDSNEVVPKIDFEPNENQVRSQLETLANKKPEEFVNLLRTWLAEE